MKKKAIFNLAKKLWPIHRTIAGPGLRASLKIIKSEQNSLIIKSIKTGHKVYDWKIPEEWEIKDAWIKYKNKKILDYKKNNLHIVGHSRKIHKKINLIDLKKKIHFIKKLPNAIPYVTSYYKKYWGFCLPYNNFKKLSNGEYVVHINSKFKKGNLNYGELVLKGKSKKEILFSTYLCHPSLANNEISGPCVNTFLTKYLQKIKNRHYTYRFIFVPETIGSIAYINKNLLNLKKNLLAGFNISCVGDERAYSYIGSRKGDTIADYVAKKVLYSTDKRFKKYDWLQRGSDERQFCSPGVDLPLCTISRSKFGEYKEYHNSLDILGKVVTSNGLNTSLELLKKIIIFFENNYFFNSTFKCEPFMSKRNLYETISIAKEDNKDKRGTTNTEILMNVLSLCDGKTDLDTICQKNKLSKLKVTKAIEILEKNKLIYKTKL
jgi:aminopeptidase-like protein